MKEKINSKEILKVLLFVLPYIVVEFTNIILITIDKSLSNSIGPIAIIVFGAFVSLDSAINVFQECISQSHSIVLARDRNNSKDINTTGLFLQIISSVLISSLIFVFANKITYIYTLETDARNILTVLLKLKALQLPILSVSYISKNDLKIKNKTNLILIATSISSLFNIIGDLVSIKLGFGEVGIYFATIFATILNTLLLLIFTKYKHATIRIKYVKEILFHVKDFVFNKVIQKIAYILYERVASSFGTYIYLLNCICGNVVLILIQLADGYHSGLLVSYAESIENKEKNYYIRLIK